MPPKVEFCVLSRFKIASRVNLLIGLAALGMVLCSGIGLWALREQMYEDRRVQLRELTQVILYYARQSMNAAGGAETDAGREAFVSAVSSVRFGEDQTNYVFAYDYNGVTIIHPNKALIGKNRLDLVFANGLKMMPDFIDIASSPSGFGYIEYPLPKDFKGAPTPKLTLIQNVPELKFFVGAGIYVSDVAAVFLQRLWVEGWLLAVSLAIIGLVCYIVSRSITEPLSTLVGKIASLAKGDLTIAPVQTSENTEIGEAGRAVEVLRVNAVQQRALQSQINEQNKLLIEEKEKAEQAVKAKSEFLSNMSHELRTPMHAVLAFADMSIVAIDEENPQGVRKYQQNIKHAGKRLLGLLNDLLDLAKMEAGRMTIALERGDLKEAVDHALMELNPLIKVKKLEIRTSFAKRNMESMFDKSLMIQVLVNLLSNAIKFSNPGGHIVVELSEDNPAASAPELRCRVIDEGPGIPESELNAVFDMFIQSSKTKSGAGGTGLGLAICQKVVEAHGGRIWAENGKTSGVIFTFVIPQKDACFSSPRQQQPCNADDVASAAALPYASC
jgi:signal transduction histidine kinase